MLFNLSFTYASFLLKAYSSLLFLCSIEFSDCLAKSSNDYLINLFYDSALFSINVLSSFILPSQFSSVSSAFSSSIIIMYFAFQNINHHQNKCSFSDMIAHSSLYLLFSKVSWILSNVSPIIDTSKFKKIIKVITVFIIQIVHTSPS